MSAPQHNPDRLDHVERLLAEIANRQNQTERLARSALQAIGEAGRIVAETGKLAAGNAERMDRAEQLLADGAERMAHTERLISNCGKTLAETLEMTGGNAERTDRIERNLDQIANHMNFLGSIVAGHAAQPVPPAHQGQD